MDVGFVLHNREDSKSTKKRCKAPPVSIAGGQVFGTQPSINGLFYLQRTCRAGRASDTAARPGTLLTLGYSRLRHPHTFGVRANAETTVHTLDSLQQPMFRKVTGSKDSSIPKAPGLVVARNTVCTGWGRGGGGQHGILNKRGGLHEGKA